MQPSPFRKLNIDLPVEKITDYHPWQLAGWVVAISFVLLATYFYLHSIGIL